MSTCTTLKSYKGRGAVSMALYTNGTLGAWAPVAEARRLEINISQDFEDQYSRCDPASANIIHALNQSDYEMTLEAFDWSPAMLAKAYYGTASTVSGSSTTDESLGALAAGESKPLVNPFGISAVTVTDGVTAQTEGTDYSVDYDHGIITAINPITDCLVDYTWVDYDKVEGALASVKEYAIRFDGYNINNSDEPVQVTLHRVATNNSASLALITEETAVIEITGKMLADSTKGTGESKYFVVKSKA